MLTAVVFLLNVEIALYLQNVLIALGKNVAVGGFQCNGTVTIFTIRQE